MHRAGREENVNGTKGECLPEYAENHSFEFHSPVLVQHLYHVVHRFIDLHRETDTNISYFIILSSIRKKAFVISKMFILAIKSEDFSTTH